MAEFFLTNKAVEDLTDIWDYTVETWSENQSEHYYLLLMDSCKELAEKPARGKSYETVDKNVFGYKTGQHVIFYRILSENEIEIARILHGMMDLKSKI